MDHLQHYWIELAMKGDRAAQYALYNMYSKAMYNISVRLTGNKHDAEDILQEAFITAFNKLDQLKDAKQFGGWLKRIVINHSLRAVKSRENWSELGDHDTIVEEDNSGQWSDIPMDVINTAITGLPTGGRQVFVLHLMEGLKHKDIADMLGISESTSKSQYIRAKQLLRERLTLKSMI